MGDETFLGNSREDSALIFAGRQEKYLPETDIREMIGDFSLPVDSKIYFVFKMIFEQ
jgi:hypothetical protein